MFVTYIVLDPRHPGVYTSPLCTFLFKPVYIGKGDAYRAEGVNRVLNNESLNPHAGRRLHNWCTGMRRQGFQNVPILKIEADDEVHAFAMEEVLTHHFGLDVLGNGILLNGRYGGDGGWSMTPETKSLLSLLNKGENNPHYGKKQSAETIAKRAATWASKERRRTPESMANAWAGMRKKYTITTTSGEVFNVDDLTNWCKDKGLSLTTLRGALKTEDGKVVTKPQLRRDGTNYRKPGPMEGWTIKYA